MGLSAPNIAQQAERVRDVERGELALRPGLTHLLNRLPTPSDAYALTGKPA